MTRPLPGRRPSLTPDQVRELRAWAASRRTARQMAAALGISTSRLHAYVRGEQKRFRPEVA